MLERAGAVQKVICKSIFQISRIVRKFLKCSFFKLALCILYYEEFVDVTFLILVRKLTKLLANKAKQFGDLKTYLEQLFEK